MTKIKDIYNGDYLTVWEDETFVYICFPWACVNVLKKEWKIIKQEFIKIAEQDDRTKNIKRLRSRK